MRVTIDRFEGEFAVCEREDRTMINIPRSRLPRRAREGDILIIEGDSIKLDSAGTTRKKEAIEKLMKDLWADNNKQD